MARRKVENWEESPWGNVLPDQFQTVAGVLGSNWCEETFVFFRPIRGQHTLESFRVFLLNTT